MRLLESVFVTMFEREVPILFVPQSLLLEIILGHHVQFCGCRELCIPWRLLSRSLADPIPRPLLRCAAMSSAMRVERSHTAHHKRRHRHHHEKPNWFEFSRHDLSQANHTRLLRAMFYDAVPAVSSGRYSTVK